ncbi:hypothetical protein Goarm_005101 [Gossypium armourianum]|uniref:RING-CH-type domain-containing protein n=1 Tax=Gossypium armourianum TaxID=34283 RepID=A0A7J9JYU5_9ROSI|nr:hypothetical protein [Gossypium armourianum]
MQLVSNDSRKEDISEREPILCQPDISQTSEECEIAAVGGDCIVVSEDLEEINVDETSHLVNADHPQCRICLDNEGDDLIAPCYCRGTQKYVHRSCLDNWRSTKEGFAFAHCTECRALFILRANVPPDRWWLRLKFQFLVARDHAFIFVIVQLPQLDVLEVEEEETRVKNRRVSLVVHRMIATFSKEGEDWRQIGNLLAISKDTRSDVDGVKITDLVFTIKSDSAERKLIAEFKKDLESLKACNSVKEYLQSSELRNLMQFGSTTAVFSKMQVAGDLHIFQFETKQGEEICVALQTSLLEKNMMEVRLESNAKGNMAITLYESLHKLQDELKLHNEELHMAEKRARRLTEEIVAFLGVLVYKFYGAELREMFGYDEHPYGFYTMAVLAIVLVGLLYGFFIAIICGQRINERHYHVLAKQELTKEYVVEDREDNKNTPELDPSHVTELRMLGLY